MMHLPESVALPLQMDEDRQIRVSGTRITLHTILKAYNAGMHAEAIHEAFPTLPLADVHAIISYYLAEKDVVDVYLNQVDIEGERIKNEWQSRYTSEQQARTEQFRQMIAAKRQNSES